MKSIYNCTACRTLKQIGYSSRRPHQVQILSAKNRKLRAQFPQDYKKWTTEGWKNVASSDESQFLLWDLGGSVSNDVGVNLLAHFWALTTNWALCKPYSHNCHWWCPSLYERSESLRNVLVPWKRKARKGSFMRHYMISKVYNNIILVGRMWHFYVSIANKKTIKL